MTNRSESRHLAPSLPPPSLPPFLLPLVFFTAPSLLRPSTFSLSLPLSLPPCSPEGSLEVAPLNTEAGAEMHQVLSLRHSCVIGCDETGGSGLSWPSIICQGMAVRQEKMFVCQVKGSRTFCGSDEAVVNITVCVSVTCESVFVRGAEGRKKNLDWHWLCFDK